MNSRFSKQVMQELAFKYNMSFDEVEGIIKSPFRVLAETIRSSTFDVYQNVQIMHWGVYFINPESKRIKRKRERLARESKQDEVQQDGRDDT